MESRTQVKRSAGRERSTERGLNEPRKGVDMHIFREEGKKLADFHIPGLYFFSLRSQPILIHICTSPNGQMQ